LLKFRNLSCVVVVVLGSCAGEETECVPLDSAQYYGHYEQLVGGTCGQLQDGTQINGCKYSTIMADANGCNVTRTALCNGEFFEFSLVSNQAGVWEGTLHASITGEDAGPSCASDYRVVLLKK